MALLRGRFACVALYCPTVHAGALSRAVRGGYPGRAASWRLYVSCSDARPVRRDPADLAPRLRRARRSLAAMPFYSITAQIDPAARVYTGSLDLDFTVSSTLPLSDIYFRTYPNLQFFGGKLDLTVRTRRRQDGQLRPSSRPHGGSARLARAPQAGQPRRMSPWPTRGRSCTSRCRASTRSSASTKARPASPISTRSSPPRRGDEWALDVPHPQGDVGFADASLYQVTLTYPSNQVRRCYRQRNYAHGQRRLDDRSLRAWART